MEMYGWPAYVGGSYWRCECQMKKAPKGVSGQCLSKFQELFGLKTPYIVQALPYTLYFCDFTDESETLPELARAGIQWRCDAE